MLKTSKRFLGIGVLVLALDCLGSGGAQALTLSSTVREDNGATSNGLDGNQSLASTPVPNPAVATTAGGYDFTTTGYLSLTSITSISVTLTIQDGNSGNVVGAATRRDPTSTSATCASRSTGRILV